MPQTKTSYKVKVNGYLFEFTEAEIAAVDFIRKSETEASLILNHQSAKALLTDTDLSGKKSNIELNGSSYEIEIKDELDIRLEQMGFNAVSTKHIKEVKAPMPGMVLEISVTEGQEVNEGDRILILSAMKMENVIQIQSAGKIKKINVKAGQAVDKGQIMIELE
jgi:biotin carboxyl carrier protein